MPSQNDLTAAQNATALYAIQNQAQFSKLQVYFVLNQIEQIPQMEVFGGLFGDVAWQPNMGPTMQGVRIEPTPKIRTTFRPNTVQQKALIDVYDQRENQERAVVYWHKFRGPLVYFLRNWQDFLSNQIQPAMEDINDQVVFANEMFIQTMLWDRAPNVYFAGRGLQAAQHNGPPNYQADPKSPAWLSDQVAQIPAGGGLLTLPMLEHVLLSAREEQKVAPFNGVKNFNPKENDLLQGKYVFLTSVEQWCQLKWDPAFQTLRSLNQDYAFSKWRGSPYEDLLVRGLDKPWRFDAQGTFVAPEVQEEQTGEAIPNPNYANINTAPWEVGWFLGGQAARSIKIGPPPKEFAGGVSPKQATGMNWNGKIYITTNVLTQEVNSDGGLVYDANSWGEYLRLQGTLTMGLLPKRPRNAIPVIYRRSRTATGVRA